MEEKKLNLDQKLALIREIADVAKKNKQGFGYKYADLEAILPQVKAGMKKYGVSLIPEILDTTVEQLNIVNKKFDKQGNPIETVATEFMTRCNMNYIWVDNETGKERKVPWFAVGSQADPSQGFGTALTYSERYFLISYFQIPITENDPEQYRKQKKDAEEAEDRATAKAIIDMYDKKVRSFLADYPDKADVVRKLGMRYVPKSGDYTKITDPALAQKLLEEFVNTIECTISGGK